MLRRVSLAVAVAALLMASTPIMAASFDCGSAVNRIDRMICANGELSSLDDRLGAAYAAAGGSAATELARDERRWIAERNRCPNDACLVATYRERIEYLLSRPTGTSSIPVQPLDRPAALADNADAVHYWGLPTLQGTPVLQYGQPTPPTSGSPLGVFWPVGKIWPLNRVGWLPPPSVGWNRAIGALGLSLAPQTIGTFDDLTLRNLACNLLEEEPRAVFYGRSPLYFQLGSKRDVCAAGTIPGSAAMADVAPGLLPLLQIGGARFRDEALQEVMRHAPKLPMRVLVTWPVQLQGQYDRARGGYPLFSAIFLDPGSRIFGSPVDFITPRLWPLSVSDAAAFESRYNPRLYATLQLAMPLTITGNVPLASGGERNETNLPDGQIWRFETGPISLYEDGGLTHKLYSFGPTGALPVDQLAAGERAAPGDARSNAADAVRSWNLPVTSGLPVVTVSDHEPSLVDFSNLGGLQNASLIWTRVIRALGLSLAPEKARALPDADLLRYARLFLPPSRLASVGPGQRCDSNLYIPGCEFVVRDFAAAFRSQDLPGIIRSAPKLPLQIMLTAQMRTEAWNAARGGFPLVPNGVSPNQTFYPPVFGTALDTPVPIFWPADEAEARKFVAQQNGGAGSSSSVYLGLPLTVTGMHAFPHQGDESFAAQTGLPAGADWVYQPGEAALYADPALTRKLYSFGPSRRLPAQLGTDEATHPKPAGAVVLNDDTALLLLLRSGKLDPAAIEWRIAAQVRLSQEDMFRGDLDYSLREPWGLFFDRPRRGVSAPPDAQEIEAFRSWTEKRSAALPNELTMRLPLWQAQGKQRLVPFDMTTRTEMIHSAWPFPGTRESLRDYGPALRSLGISPEQMLPLAFTIPGTKLLALFATPRPAASFDVDLPQGIPPNRSVSSSGDPAAILGVTVQTDGFDALRTAGIRDRDAAMLVRTQPVQAIVSRSTKNGLFTLPIAGEAPLASVGFAASSWAAPEPPPPPPSPPKAAPPVAWQGPLPEARLAGAPYGPDIVGLQLGMTMEDAEKTIRGHMQVASFLETDTPADAGASISMIRGKVFVGNDRSDPQFSEQIAIFEAAPQAAGKLIVIQRSIYIAQSAWEALVPKLREKYGPDNRQLASPPFEMTWTAGTRQDCDIRESERPRWAATPEFPGRRIERIRTVAIPLPKAEQTETVARCGPMLRISNGGGESMADGVLLSLFTTKLFDPGVLAWMVRQRPPAASPIKL